MVLSDGLLPGTVIAGKYRVERMLGKGGTAVVVEATHVALGHRVAVKVLEGEAARHPDAIVRFLREAQIAAQLPGDHVARVSDLGQTESGQPFLVMELLVGRDLEAELAARGALPIEEAVQYVLQACEGVADAHAAGLVHRDLKPGNLFVTRKRDGTPAIKVLDFGISKSTRAPSHALTMTTSNFGTPMYMSPEQIQSAKHVDARCDQHALGAILYALLAGRPPYDAQSLTALAVVIATQPPKPLRELRPEVPAELERAVLRALAKSPADRFPALPELARAIAPFAGPAGEASLRAIASALGPGSQAPPPVSGPSVGPAGAPPKPAGGVMAQTSAGLSSAIRVERARLHPQSIQVMVALVSLAAGVAIAAVAIGPTLRGNASVAAAPPPADLGTAHVESAPSVAPAEPIVAPGSTASATATSAATAAPAAPSPASSQPAPAAAAAFPAASGEPAAGAGATAVSGAKPTAAGAGPWRGSQQGRSGQPWPKGKSPSEVFGARR